MTTKEDLERAIAELEVLVAAGGPSAYASVSIGYFDPEDPEGNDNCLRYTRKWSEGLQHEQRTFWQRLAEVFA
jgi:hypothetical protein